METSALNVILGSSSRGGVVAPSKNIAEGILNKARTGWSKTFLTTPSAPAAVASQHFLARRSHPSSGGGDYDSHWLKLFGSLREFYLGNKPFYVLPDHDLAKVTVLNGTVRTRTPVASKIAFPSAAATGAVAASPAPSGGRVGLLIKATSIAGASGKVRIG